jgi:hypothetical protein
MPAGKQLSKFVLASAAISLLGVIAARDVYAQGATSGEPGRARTGRSSASLSDDVISQPLSTAARSAFTPAIIRPNRVATGQAQRLPSVPASHRDTATRLPLCTDRGDQDAGEQQKGAHLEGRITSRGDGPRTNKGIVRGTVQPLVYKAQRT